MEMIMEFLFELIAEGALEVSSDRKMPMPVRIIAAVVLTGIYGGLTGFCFWSGIHDRNWAVLILGIVILVITVLGARSVYRKHRQ